MLGEIGAELVEEVCLRLVVAFEVLGIAETFDSLALVTRKRLWHKHADVDKNVAIAVAIALNSRQTLATQAERLTRLGSRLYLHLQLATLNGGYLHIASKGSRREVENEVIYKVLTLTHEGIVLLLFDEYLDVARHTIATPCIALTRSIDYHTVLNAGRDVYLDDFLTVLNALAVTLRTLVLDNLSFTVTGRTDALCLHHAKDRLLLLYHHTGAMTRSTRLKSCTATTVTGRTGDILAHLELLGNARSNLKQIEAHLQT